MSDDYRMFIYDEDEVIARAQRIAEIRDRRERPWLFKEHQPYLKAMMDDVAKEREHSSLKPFDKRADLS